MKKAMGRRRSAQKAGRGAAEEKLILLGAHFSIAGGLTRALDEAAAYGCPVLQMFTKNASTWKEREVGEAEAEAFRRRRQALGIRFVASHTAYLINLAAGKGDLRRRSREALRCEMERSARLGLDAVVLHPGSHGGDGEKTGIARIREGIDTVMASVPEAGCRLLLETTAGQGTGIGHRFEQLAVIREGLSSRQRIGFCLDTAHVFAAGYDLRDAATLRRTLAEFDARCGLENLLLVHLNDALKPLGSRVDRHASIGEGCIGIEGFAAIMRERRLASIPKILETPKKDDAGRDLDRVNLDLLRSLERPPCQPFCINGISWDKRRAHSRFSCRPGPWSISMRHIDILYANHWPEVVSLLAERVRPGDALVTEDAPSPEFAQMLAGDLPIDDYLMLTDIEFPEFGRRVCRLWQRLHQADVA